MFMSIPQCVILEIPDTLRQWLHILFWWSISGNSSKNCIVGILPTCPINVYVFHYRDMYSYMPLEQIPTVKDVWKWICGSKVESRLGCKFALEYLDILIDFEHIILSSECNKLEETFRDHFKKRKGQRTEQFTRNNVMNAIQSVSRDKLRTIITYPPNKLTDACSLRSIVCKHNPVYVAGKS